MAWSWYQITVGQRLAGHVPVFGIAIALRRNEAAVQVGDNAHLGIAFGAVEPIVDGKEMLLR